jgi:hypothetical protein
MHAKKLLYIGLHASIITGSLFAKPLPSKYGQMQNGHVTSACLSDIKRDSENARNNLDPARYGEIVRDPQQARSDEERIAALAAREIIYLVDRSGSMAAADSDPTGYRRGNWSRWDSALEVGKSLFEVALNLDSDGMLDVMLWDYDSKGPRYVHQTIKRMDDLETLFSRNRPSGYTPLAEALEEVYNQKLRGMLDRAEPFTVIVLTDGVPGNGFESAAHAQEKVYNFFRKLVSNHHLADHGRETLAAFSFVQSGDDREAERFLTTLDDEMKTGYIDTSGYRQDGLGIDIIDYKKDNFIFGTDAYRGVQGVGPLGIFWGAMFD